MPNPPTSPLTQESAAACSGRSFFVSAPDGLRLHVREYRPPAPSRLPVVCLPGLTRTTADFDELAPALAANGRRVIAIDYRGRGQSEYDPDPQHYNVAIELADVIAALAALQIGSAVFIGSSRGGILTMLLAAGQPQAIAGAVLHDIGPVIEPMGLARIRSYVGKLPQPNSVEHGAEILRQLFVTHFPKLTAEHWLAAARRTWKLEHGGLVPTYDVRLATTLAEINLDQPLADLWNEFGLLARVPILVIRGANSDVLSAATLDAMRTRHPNLQTIEVVDQGHVPLLEGAELLQRIAAFIEKCDSERSSR